MKKFTKILLGVILSVAMVVTGALAFNNYSNAFAKSSLYYEGYGVISTSTDGATVEHGAYKQISANATFTGVKLAGPAGSTFNLGTVDIGASDWAGSQTATAPADENNKNESLLEFVFNPTIAIDKATQDALDNYMLRFIFTQNDKSLTIQVRNYGHKSEASALSFFAQGNGQSKLGGYRYNNGFKAYAETATSKPSINRKMLLKSDAANMGVTLNSDAATVATGWSTYANMIYYDFDDVSLYTPQKYVTSSELDKSLLIRDLNATDVTNGEDTPWSGFTKDKNGSCKVSVQVVFDKMEHNNTVVVTKLGNVVFNGENVKAKVDDVDSVDGETDVVKGVTATNGTVKYGTYKQFASNYSYTGINLIGGVGATFNLGTMSINDTYFDDNYAFIKDVGVVDLSTKNGSSYTQYISTSKYTTNRFTGTNQAVTNLPADSRSFLSFVVNPSLACDNNSMTKSFFKVTLREVGKPENFVTYHIKMAKYDATPAGQEILITCTGTNNSNDTSERFATTGIKFENVRRTINQNGNQAYAISLYYDFSQQAAYTNVSSTHNTEIKRSLRIRDFDAISTNASDFASIPSGVANWEGFSKDAQVEITLEMTGLNNAAENNSIVLTDLAGYNYNVVDVSTVEEIVFLSGNTADLGRVVCADTKTASYITNTDFASTLVYKVNGEVVDRVTTLNNNDIITVFSQEGVQIGSEVLAVERELVSDVSAENGSYEVYRNGVLVPDGEVIVGDVIKFIPGKEKLSELHLPDLRSVNIGDKTYIFNTSTKTNDAPLVKHGEGNDIYYEYKVVESDVVRGNELNISVAFDKYCKITFKDNADPNNVIITEVYDWAAVGSVSFPLITAKLDTKIYRGTSTDENTVLVAWGRNDIGYKNDKGEFVYKRDDYKVPNYTIEGSNSMLSYYAARKLGADNTARNYLAIVPDMEFETIYVKMWIEAEIKLQSGAEKYSGLRFTVKFDKADVDNYLRYCFNSGINTKNPFGNMHNYITTQGELNAANKITDITKLNPNSFYTDGNGWANETKPNNAGLVNGTGKTAAQMGDTPGYVHMSFDSNANIWNELISNDDYYAYGITVNGFKTANIEKEYVFISFINIMEINGSTTAFVMNAKKVQPKELAVKKLNDVLLTTEPNHTYYTVNDGVNNYYTAYKAADIKWLASMAGDEREFYNGKIEA